MGAGAEDDDQEGREQSQHEDAVREDQPVAEGGELARQIAVPGEKRSEAGEVGVARVGGQDQDAIVVICTK